MTQVTATLKVPVEVHQVSDSNLSKLCLKFRLDSAAVMVGDYITVQYIGASRIADLRSDLNEPVLISDIPSNALLIRVWREDVFLKYHELSN